MKGHDHEFPVQVGIGTTCYCGVCDMVYIKQTRTAWVPRDFRKATKSERTQATFYIKAGLWTRIRNKLQ